MKNSINQSTKLSKGTLDSGISYIAYSPATCITSQVSKEANNQEQKAEKPSWLGVHTLQLDGKKPTSKKKRTKKSATAKKAETAEPIAESKETKEEVNNKTEGTWCERNGKKPIFSGTFVKKDNSKKVTSKNNSKSAPAGKKTAKKAEKKPTSKKSKITILRQEEDLLLAQIDKAKNDKKAVKPLKTRLSEVYAELATLV